MLDKICSTEFLYIFSRKKLNVENSFFCKSCSNQKKNYKISNCARKHRRKERIGQGMLKGEVSLYSVDLLFDWFRISCMTTDNFCFYLQNRLIQTSQTGGQWYSDTSPFSIPWIGDGM